ncbi:MAG TPA: GNAT family N-acyltransferase [Oligoflexus sp.]|uniref:GNAT family N-acetyltransferase n=1 Tax=Oligoflexus sp. TaxID=1971216 RepID=UPI002D629EC3|nr:GNAT family N-acyltransferase [Oligoflexus sp.]HYX35239.1 GNAT family N-acyltransferase [Oligoflexus sp.]
MQTDHAFAPIWTCDALGLDIELPSSWKAKVPIHLEQARYIIKTADSAEEFRQVIDLRSAVFIEEFAGKTGSRRMDLEARDQAADFLIIQDRDTREVLASYRLLCSDFTDDFYSCSEFMIDSFLQSDGKKLELSRACVRPDKRSKGIFVHLLWRGLAAYSAAVGSRYLFGCSSVQSLDLRHLVQVYQYLHQSGCLDDRFPVQPISGYSIIDKEGLLALVMKSVSSLGESLLPPILAGYLKAGARIYGAPAFDQDFQCLDLFTVLDFDRLSEAHGRKYMRS